jgi:hypothetical protein
MIIIYIISYDCHLNWYQLIYVGINTQLLLVFIYYDSIIDYINFIIFKYNSFSDFALQSSVKNTYFNVVLQW